MTATDLTLRPFFWRATQLFQDRKIVSRTHEGITRYTYGEVGERVKGLAAGLSSLGVSEGDRIGTLGWNDHRHYEAYFAVPLMGAQLHTINVQLPDSHIEYIIKDAADDVLLVHPSMVKTVERLWEKFDSVRDVVVMGEEVPETPLDVYSYENLVNAHRSDNFSWPSIDEDQPAGMCYTSGTTGRPKGVEYTHKMYYVHAMMVMTPAALNVSESEIVMPVVPMYHVNSWEFPYAATMAGAPQVYPGPSPNSGDLVRLIESEDVTLTAGVPTVWINVLDYLEDHDADISSLDRIIVGGSTAPANMMHRFEDEYDVATEHAWGMTETMSIGSVSRLTGTMNDWDRDHQYEKLQKQGLLSPGLEMRVVDDDGKEVPWNGKSFGELYVRGPTVAGGYYNRPDANEEAFEDDWLKTGDIVTVDEEGYIEIVDRADDVIKSGGEWISSIELETALMAHDGVFEATVIGVPEERWGERPVACVVLHEEVELTAEELRDFLDTDYDFPQWWLPDEILFIDEIPKTATGKFDKKVLTDEVAPDDLRWTPGKS